MCIMLPYPLSLVLEVASKYRLVFTRLTKRTVLSRQVMDERQCVGLNTHHRCNGSTVKDCQPECYLYPIHCHRSITTRMLDTHASSSVASGSKSVAFKPLLKVACLVTRISSFPLQRAPWMYPSTLSDLNSCWLSSFCSCNTSFHSDHSFDGISHIRCNSLTAHFADNFCCSQYLQY